MSAAGDEQLANRFRLRGAIRPVQPADSPGHAPWFWAKTFHLGAGAAVGSFDLTEWQRRGRGGAWSVRSANATGRRFNPLHQVAFESASRRLAERVPGTTPVGSAVRFADESIRPERNRHARPFFLPRTGAGSPFLQGRGQGGGSKRRIATARSILRACPSPSQLFAGPPGAIIERRLPARFSSLERLAR